MANIDSLNINGTTYSIVPRFLGQQAQITSVEALNNFHDATGVQYATGNSSEIATALGGGIGGNGVVLSLPGTSSAYGAQLFLDDDPNPYFKFRQRSTNGSTVYDLLTSGNYTNGVPTKTGSGASGTWGINITGSSSTATSADTADSATGASQINGFSVATGVFKYGGNIALGSGSPASAAKTFWENNVPTYSMVAAYNNAGEEYSFLFSKGGDNNYGNIIRGTYARRSMQILRRTGGNGQSTDGETVTTTYADSAGYVSDTTLVI